MKRDMWIYIIIFALLVIGGILAAAPNGEESSISSTYNPGKRGVKAFYTLLNDRLGYRTDRLLNPYNKMPRKTAVLVVVQPLANAPIKPDERIALEKWVREGGTAVFISDSLRGIPVAFASSRKLGKGFIQTFRSSKFITNQGVRDYKNALPVLNVIAEHASKKDLILFDEYHHGLGKSKSRSIIALAEKQVKIGAMVLLLAGLVLCYSHGRRFGAVRQLPASETLRPGVEFVDSVGRLYERAGATDLAAEILSSSLKQSLCLKLGLSSDAPRDMIIDRMRSGGMERIAEQVNNLLRYCEPTKAGQKLSKSELLSVAKEIESIEKELGLARIDA